MLASARTAAELYAWLFMVLRAGFGIEAANGVHSLAPEAMAPACVGDR